MVYDSRRNKGRRAPRPDRRPAPESLLQPGQSILDRYIDHNGEERIVVGIHDEAMDNPSTEINDPKGESINVGVKDLNDLPVRRSMIPCDPDKHDFVNDGEPGEDIPGHQSQRCRHCPIGRIIPQA